MNSVAIYLQFEASNISSDNSDSKGTLQIIVNILNTCKDIHYFQNAISIYYIISTKPRY